MPGYTSEAYGNWTNTYGTGGGPGGVQQNIGHSIQQRQDALNLSQDQMDALYRSLNDYMFQYERITIEKEPTFQLCEGVGTAWDKKPLND